MSDQFTEITSTGYFARLGGSIVGVLFGLLLVPASVFLLYWNEGRAVDAANDISSGARQVIEVESGRLDSAADGKLVHLAGPLTTKAPARDPLFGVSGGDLVRLERTAEMYQWKEDKHTESHESVGGTKTTETTYTYARVWSPTPIDSAEFKKREGHENPPMAVHPATFDGSDVKLGVYRLGPPVLAKITDFKPFQPEAGGDAPSGWSREGEGFYRGTNPGQPAIGDERVAFKAVTTEPISVLAGLAGGTLVAHKGTRGLDLTSAKPGIVSAADMFKAEQQEQNLWTWILRGVGFVVVLIGLLLVARPVSMVLAFLPFLEGIAETGAFLIALTLAVPLTLVVIAIAWMAHRPLLGGGLIAAAIAAIVLLRWTHRRPAAAVAKPAGGVFMPPGLNS